ncbi:DNA-processing protein DprA [Sulfurimonas sp.]|jgi:DNA processing protein|uniref:DNA-processing protein DprA n=1 Tax=Sulfurimonas sp. TaxID=2022749 RepID=UPI0025E143F9|nr:DNA-processing protein DprA [Sulfurimonas sp.]MBT5933905.1 DNA-protecting protein DprA [Sulfurimonas sp.]
MIEEVNFHIGECESMKKYPTKLFYIGNTKLLTNKKISIIGSRKPNQYARHKTQELAQKLSNAGVCIVSGGAIGVDAISHKAAGSSNTILVSATGLDKRYPAINSTLIAEVERNGLVMSQFEKGSPSTKYNFVLRNELVVALGDVLVVTYADLNSGSMRSVEYALKMGKEIYVLAHRIGESAATNKLLEEGKAKAIYDIDTFVSMFGKSSIMVNKSSDDFLEFCKTNPTYDEALAKFPSRVFEAELSGEIDVRNARIYLV